MQSVHAHAFRDDFDQEQSSMRVKSSKPLRQMRIAVSGVTLKGIDLCLIAQDYDFENTSPYGTNDQIYASAFNTWQIEQVGSSIEGSPHCISLAPATLVKHVTPDCVCLQM